MNAKKYTYNAKTPFFIDPKGNAFFKPGRKLNWSDFAVVSGLPKVVSMLFRHHMSHIIMAQSTLAMVEMEEFVLCHSKATRNRSYADEQALKANVLKVQDWYVTKVVPAEQAKLKDWVKKDTASHQRVKKLHEELMEEQDRKTVKDMLEAEEKQQDLLPKITKDDKLNLFGDRTKAAFLDAILEAGTGF